MRALSQFVFSFILIASVINTAIAQDKESAAAQMIVTAYASGERVRFTAPHSVIQIRLEVYDASGKKAFDNEVRGGNVLDWLVQDGPAERLADGTYLCVVTIKSISGRLTQRISSLMVEKNSVRLQRSDPTQFNAAQLQSVGPIEENGELTVLAEDWHRTATMIAHDGKQGEITRGSGPLSFRIGDFYSGNNREQMRLTVEGNLGIGLAHPQARLDVDGLIRTSLGIVFPDGTVQYSASSKTLGARSTRPDQIMSDKQDVQPQTAGTGTQNQVAKWVDNAGTLGDSVISELSGNIGIGTNSPAKKLHIANGQIALDNGRFLYSRRNGSSSFQEAFGIDSNNDIVFNRNSIVAGVDADAPRAPSGLIFGVGGGKFLDIRNSSNTPVLRVHEVTGNIGIGTVNPSRPLEIANGKLRFSSNFGDIEFTEVADLVAHATESNPIPGDPAFRVDTGSNLTRVFTVLNNGNVGIGTADPFGKLSIEAVNWNAFYAKSNYSAVIALSTGTGAGVEASSTNGVGVVAVSQTGNLVEGYKPGMGRVFHITNGGTYVTGSDFAEALPVWGDKAGYEPGDVLVVRRHRSATVERASRPNDARLIGVYSTRPGIVGAEKNGTSRVDDNELPVAIVGIVPTKVSTENGAIQVGDLLATSGTLGYAMKASPVLIRRVKIYRTGTILGKALEPLKEGRGVIKVLVTLR